MIDTLLTTTGTPLSDGQLVSNDQFVCQIGVESLLLSELFWHIRYEDSHQRRQQNYHILEDDHKREPPDH